MNAAERAEDRVGRLQDILAEQGWLVMAWDGFGDEKVGVEVVYRDRADDGLGNPIYGPFSVIATATSDEFLEQGRRLMGQVTFESAVLVAQGAYTFWKVCPVAEIARSESKAAEGEVR